MVLGVILWRMLDAPSVVCVYAYSRIVLFSIHFPFSPCYRSGYSKKRENISSLQFYETRWLWELNVLSGRPCKCEHEVGLNDYSTFEKSIAVSTLRVESAVEQCIVTCMLTCFMYYLLSELLPAFSGRITCSIVLGVLSL